MIYSYGERRLETEGRCFIAPSADVIGSVRLGDEASIWFGAVLRGDNDWIHIGAGTNVQDGSIVHVDPGMPVTLGTRVTIGHGVLLHGCAIGDGAVIGNRAMVLDGARVGAGS
ncbi:MAG TPA: gamma carbonic anhydrase family protein, partial [Steroidobacteraceae bacterium]|nr:gamma carbonic anhydrase family protein [Steroidobacteraceae bacterium]